MNLTELVEQNTQNLTVQANLCAALAETLAEPPAWLAAAGVDWPLFEITVQLARLGNSQSVQQAVEALAAIRPESLDSRQRRYHCWTEGKGQPPVWLYESQYVDGRLVGPTTFSVQQVYRAAGIEPDGAELPDHASVELAFLGWLFEQAAANGEHRAEWLGLIQQFVKRHAGTWLPQLGHSLAAAGDPVYAPIGKLLVGWLAELTQPRRKPSTGLRLPVVPQAQACTLCGFCVQVCPTRALSIRETGAETGLLLNASTCIGCAKCQRICEFDALDMATSPDMPQGLQMLRVSDRATCPACGQPTVSRAELSAVAAQLGEWPRWLDYCSNCRSLGM